MLGIGREEGQACGALAGVTDCHGPFCQIDAHDASEPAAATEIGHAASTSAPNLEHVSTSEVDSLHHVGVELDGVPITLFRGGQG